MWEYEVDLSKWDEAPKVWTPCFNQILVKHVLQLLRWIKANQFDRLHAWRGPPNLRKILVKLFYEGKNPIEFTSEKCLRDYVRLYLKVKLMSKYFHRYFTNPLNTQ